MLKGKLPIDDDVDLPGPRLHRQPDLLQPSVRTNSLRKWQKLGTDSKKKNVIFSDIVTIAFDPHPP